MPHQGWSEGLKTITQTHTSVPALLAWLNVCVPSAGGSSNAANDANEANNANAALPRVGNESLEMLHLTGL